MSIKLFFILLLSIIYGVSSPAFATEPHETSEFCEILLTSGNTVVVPRIVINEGSFGEYDSINRRFLWRHLVGRLVSVRFSWSRTEVQQRVTSLERIKSREPVLALMIEDLLKKNERLRTHFENAIDASSLSADLRRQLPGELALMGFSRPAFKSEIDVFVSNPVRGEPGEGAVNTASLENTLAERLRILQTLAPESVGETLAIFFAHTHPGSAVPLSDADAQAFRSIMFDLQRQFPNYGFRGVSVVIPTEDRGEIIFSDDIIRLQPLSSFPSNAL